MPHPAHPLRGALRAATILALGALLAGCAAVAPPSAVPGAAQRHAPPDSASPAARDAGLGVGVPSRHWWRDLKDPRLDALVEQAMARNHELQATLATVKEARAMAGLAEREALPQGSLSAQAQAMRPSLAETDPYGQNLPRPPSRRLGTLTQSLSWEIDLFGRVGTAAAIAERQLDAARADAHAASALLQAEVVRQYVQLRRTQQESLQADEEIALLRQRAALMEQRVQAGFADRREALAATADTARAEAERARLQAVRHGSIAALAVLTGRSPTATDPDAEALAAPAALPDAPAAPQVTRPGELLANRPDVARADALLRASLGDTVLAERAHLPRLSLDAVLGLNAPFGQLGRAGALRYAAGPALQWDWLDAGRRQAREAAARAGSERAWHTFEQTVLKALEDSEGALRHWSAAQVALEQSQAARASASAAQAYASARAAAGMEAPTQALEQRVGHVRALRSELAAQADSLQAYVQVQLALAAWQPDL
ncbi:TolC family protein [Paracidovorax anthurii]|uniref:Multidrug efflux system outer membrane protein n=1 Tax=Paracidovorax anthurii TaxID=78229 RepID=A0A328Z4J5_9BURK|nr:TolC family protein [Paracidovorax anthurii]RAR80674.1 multidrug efflux system outer membrane protein [Paracidovorax anthurii]